MKPNLSPSRAHRWLQCIASAFAPASTGPANEYAERGTYLHKLGAHSLHRAVLYEHKRMSSKAISNLIGPHPLPPDSLPLQSLEHGQALSDANGYARYVLDMHATAGQPSDIYVEQAVPIDWLTTKPSISKGIVDAAFYDKAANAVYIIDAKFGRRYVSAIDNAQLMLYAWAFWQHMRRTTLPMRTAGLGADWRPEMFHMSIYQPSADEPSTVSVSFADVEGFARHAQARANAIISEAVPTPTAGAWCHYCTASPTCPAHAAVFEQVASAAPLEQLSADSISHLFSLVGIAKLYATALEEHIIDALLTAPGSIPNVVLRQGRSQRYISDPAGLIDTLSLFVPESALFEPRKIAGIGVLEGLMGKKEFAAMAEPYIAKTTPKNSPVFIQPKNDSND